MNKKVKLSIFSVTAFSLLYYNICYAENNLKVNKITNQQVEAFKNKRTFIIKFSNIIYTTKDKEIKIPIFQGIYGDVLYDNVLAYCRENKLIEPDAIESAYVIKCESGTIKETLHKFIAFYKSNILRDVDINNPTDIGLSSAGWIVRYDFKIEGKPFYIRIRFKAREADEKQTHEVKSIYDIIPEENVKYPAFFYTFGFE